MDDAIQRQVGLSPALLLGNIKHMQKQIVIAVDDVLHLPVEVERDRLAWFDDRRLNVVAC